MELVGSVTVPCTAVAMLQAEGCIHCYMNGERLVVAYFNLLPFFSYCKMTFVPPEYGLFSAYVHYSWLYCVVFVCALRISMVVLFFQIRNYNMFTQRWQLFQSAALKCIIVSVDGRGTGFRGDK